MPPETKAIPPYREYVCTPSTSVPLVRAVLKDPDTKTKLSRLNLLLPPLDLLRPSFRHVLTAMNRETGDDTGILAPLIDVSSGPDETLEIAYRLAGNEIERLIQSGISIHDLKTACLGGRCSPVLFKEMDKTWGNLVRGIRMVAVEKGMVEINPDGTIPLTPKAAEYRQTNVDLIHALNRKMGRLSDRKLVFDPDGNLTDVTEALIVPTIPHPEPLLALIPDELRTGNGKSTRVMSDQLFLLRKGGQVGHDVSRYIANLLNAQEREQTLFEQYRGHL